MDLRVLTAEEVLLIHEILVRDFAESHDPISPPGLRSLDLLHSAVGRQLTSFGPTLKYSESIPNAATLLYGLCNDHPFHNGNKRTALVAMLVHLDRNKLTLFHTSQNELYELMLRVASHELFGRPSKRERRPRRAPPADHEVAKIAEWLKERADRVKRGERQITYRELRRVLERFDYFLVHPKGNAIEIVKKVEERRGLFPRRTVSVNKHIDTIPWPGESRQMAVSDIKKVRNICRLREEDGVDSDAFYDDTAVIDTFVNRYRSVLRRLARV